MFLAELFKWIKINFGAFLERHKTTVYQLYINTLWARLKE